MNRKTKLVFTLFSFAVGLSFSLGHITGFFMFGRSYTPLVYDAWMVRGVGSPNYFHAFDHVTWDETVAYARYVHEILRGEWLGATPDVYDRYAEGKLAHESPWPRDRLGPALLALLSLPFAGNVSAGFMAADFVFPALVAFSLLILCRQLLPSTWWCLLAASLVIWFSLSDVAGLLYLYWGAPHYGPIFVRTAYPQISFIFFVAFLLAMLRLYRQPSWRSAALLAAALVLNFYTYVYAWTLALAMMGACALVLLVFQTTSSKVRAETGDLLRLLIGSTAAALVLALPIWLPLVTRPPAMQDFFIRLGGGITHQADLLSLSLCALLAALAFWGGRAGWPHGWFWMVFWLASVIVNNQQVFTGRELQPFHYLSFFIGPLLPLFLCDFGAWRLPQAAAASHSQAREQAGHCLVMGVMVLGFAQCAFRLSQPVLQERDFHTVDANFQQVVSLLGGRALRNYGFLTNDPFLDEVLPAFIPQKSLQPWWMDPLSNHEMGALHSAAAHVLEAPVEAHGGSAGFRFDQAKVILVLNRHRPIRVHPASCQILLSNPDFLLVSAAPCGAQTRN